jgi:hypothetical protein
MPVPATFYDCLIIPLVLVYLLGQGGGATLGRPPDSITLNVRRVAGGTAGMAVFAFVMVSAANDLHGFGRLAQFFMQLRWPPPFLLAAAFGVLGLLLFVSLGRFAAGCPGPFPLRRSIMAVGDFLWLAGAAGVWLWGGLFLDDRTSWLGEWTRRWNFALTGLLLVVCVYAAASIMVALRGGGDDAEKMIEKFRKRRTAPMVGTKRRKF